MRDRTRFFKTVDFGNGITRIEATGIVYCYLVEGTRSALLIDTMTGLGDLKSFVKQYTDLPVRAVHTHGHFDHIGGSYDFDEAWIPKRDIHLLPENEPVQRKFWFEKRICKLRRRHVDFTPADFAVPRRIMWHPMEDGTRFSLGGRIVTAVDMPGHTPGSMGLLDSKTGILFSGDAGSRSTFMFLAGSTALSVYYQGLKRLKLMRGHQISEWYNFHNYTEMPPVILDELIAAARSALNGHIEGPCIRNTPTYRFVYPVDRHWRRLDGKIGNIIVPTDKIR